MSAQAGAGAVADVRHGWPSLFAYSALRMPLALLELPLFVLLPNFYSRSLGLDLAIIGIVLFAGRLIDALADPLIGSTMDRLRARFDYRHWIWFGLPVLVIGFAAMFAPPSNSEWALAAWLATTSVVTYLAYSTVSIAYQSWGAGIGTNTVERTRVTTTREGFGLLGVVCASALLAPRYVVPLVAGFAVLSLVSAVAAAYAPAPAAAREPRAPGTIPFGNWAAWREVLQTPSFRWLLGAFMLNGVATAIPATLVLFFIRDVLGGDDGSIALFLISYFAAGALGMPLWVHLARRFGLRTTWLFGMASSVLAFMWALSLGHGDTLPFLAVCVLTGLALGSDLAIPPALLSATIADAGHDGRREGSYFGLWNLATKMNLAIAAGLALPALAWMGYEPGRGTDTLALSLAYAALPCALKLAAGVVVLLAPLPHTGPSQPPRQLPHGGA